MNKVESGVRISHRPSGASVRCCDTRDQFRNKQIAFKRMVESKEFQTWHKIETARRMAGSDYKTIEERVEEAMAPENIKTEVKDDNGKWQVHSGVEQRGSSPGS